VISRQQLQEICSSKCWTSPWSAIIAYWLKNINDRGPWCDLEPELTLLHLVKDLLLKVWGKLAEGGKDFLIINCIASFWIFSIRWVWECWDLISLNFNCVCTNASFNGHQLLIWVFAAVCKRISGVPTFRSVKWTASTQLQACVVYTLFADGGYAVWGQNCPLVVLLSKLLMLRALQMIQGIHSFDYQLFECCPKSVLWLSIWCILFVNLMFFA